MGAGTNRGQVRGSVRAAFAVWVLSATLYGSYYQAQWAFGERPIFAITGDEPHYLTIATSLITDRDLDVLDEYRDKEYFPFYPFHLGDARDMEDMHALYGRQGGVFSKHSVGLPLLLAPAMRLGGHGLATLLMIVLTAALAAQIWLLVRDALAEPAPISTPRVSAYRSVNGWSPWLAWAAVALTPPLLLYAPLFYPEVAGALLTVAAVRSVLAYQRGGGPRSLAWVGAACGVLPWLHLRYVPIALAIGTVALAGLALRWRHGGARAADSAALAAPAMVGGALLLALNWTLFGGVPPVDEYGTVSLARFAAGGPGLFFDRQFGLLPYSPAYALVPLGMVAHWRRNRLEAVTVVLPFLAYAGFVACFSYWYGAFSPPARMLVPVLPLVAAPIAVALRQWVSAQWACVVLLLATAWVAKLLVDVPRLRYNLPTGSSAALEYLSDLWGRDVTSWLPTFILADSSSYVWAASAALAVAALSLGLTRLGPRSR